MMGLEYESRITVNLVSKIAKRIAKPVWFGYPFCVAGGG